MFESLHGGPDAQGVAPHDFSTNSNACGPCPLAMQAVREADASHYPDPHYTDLRARLAKWHGVAPERIVLAGSGSEFIGRITAWTRMQTGTDRPRVHWPAQSYGDYARSAQALGLPAATQWADATLIWACEPSSPMGQDMPNLIEMVMALREDQRVVLDLAYAPLRLSSASAILSHAARDRVWQMWTPNKALGMTGVRAAYAIAPLDADRVAHALQALAPSWVMGAHGVAMLQAWTDDGVQQWLHAAKDSLREWKTQQMAWCASVGWHVAHSETNYFCARLPEPGSDALWQGLRAHGVKLRDATSFGLPGWVRMGVLPPASQAALAHAWTERLA